MADRFRYLTSTEAENTSGVWNWAKAFVEDLNKLRRLWELADMDLAGKGGHTVKVKADETGFELVP